MCIFLALFNSSLRRSKLRFHAFSQLHFYGANNRLSLTMAQLVADSLLFHNTLLCHQWPSLIEAKYFDIAGTHSAHTTMWNTKSSRNFIHAIHLFGSSTLWSCSTLSSVDKMCSHICWQSSYIPKKPFSNNSHRFVMVYILNWWWLSVGLHFLDHRKRVTVQIFNLVLLANGVTCFMANNGRTNRSYKVGNIATADGNGILPVLTKTFIKIPLSEKIIQLVGGVQLTFWLNLVVKIKKPISLIYSYQTLIILTK